MSSIDITLKGDHGQILLFQEIQVQQSNCDDFVITTVSGHVCMLSIENNKYKFTYEFQLNKPCTAIFYNQQTKILVLGCVNGVIYKYNCMNKQIENQIYQQKTQERSQLECIYVRQNFIFAWNINSEVMIIELRNMTLKSLLKFSCDITSVISITNNSLSKPSPCVAFNNNLAPFIFDCDSATQMIQTYNYLTKNYIENEQKINGEIYFMTYERKNRESNQIACYTSQKTQDEIIHFLCMYSIRISDRFKICEIQLRIVMDFRPIFLNIYQEYTTCIYSKRIKIYNLASRKIIGTLKNQNQIVWGFLSKSNNLRGSRIQYSNEEIYKYVFSSGINVLSEDIEKESSVVYVREIPRLRQQ